MKSLTLFQFLVLAGGISASGAYLFVRCSPSHHSGTPDSGARTGTTLAIYNDTPQDAVAFVAFGSDSVVGPIDWAFCGNEAGAPLNCQFTLKAQEGKLLPLSGRYLNASISFNAPVGCGSTKAELNVNNPKWYDTSDVSLVDGYSNGIRIEVMNAAADAGFVRLGPPNGPKDNEQVFGLFPLGCDICTARQSPPCGIVPGGSGCKAGTQYHPVVPCQYQGAVMGGGGAKINVVLVGIPLVK